VNPAAKQSRHAGSSCELGALGQIAPRLLHGAPRHVFHEEDGDIVQHQCADDFIDTASNLEEGRQCSPQRAAECAGKEHDQDQQCARPLIREVQRDRAAGKCTDIILTFAADVPDARPECRGQSQPHQQQRSSFQQRLFDLPPATERTLHHG